MSAEAGEQQQQGGPVIVVPPGFRFHPTDEELLHYYLRKKVSYEASFDLDVIREVDLNKLEPWDLRDKCRIGSGPLDQNEWYFFSHKDKKYPTGTRTNRATNAGFWKATGRDKPIYLSNSNSKKIGMRKTLVFYTGRAPHGQKTDWIMHEYRLDDNDYDHHHHHHHHRISNNNTPHQLQVVQEDGWVVCRVFKKKSCHNGDGSRFFEPTDQAAATARGGGEEEEEEEEGRGDYPHNPYIKPSGREGASSFMDAKSKVHNNVHAHAAAAAAASLLYESSNCMHLPQLWSPESIATAFNTSSMSSSSSISNSFLCSPIMSSNLAADFQLQQNFLRPAGLLTSSYDINSSNCGGGGGGGGCGGGGDWSFLDKLLHASHMQNPQEEDHIITKFNHPHAATHHQGATPNSPSARTYTQRSYHPFQYLGCQPDTLKFSK